MELTTKTAVDVRATATRHPDGSISLRLTAHAEYADGMHTSVAIDTEDLDATVATTINAQLAALVAANETTLARKIEHAIHESRRIGRAEGELDKNFEPVTKSEDDDDA